MKIKTTEIPPAEPTYKVELELTKRELQLLEGLTNFPTWCAQSEELNDFLRALNGELYRLLDYDSIDPDVLGFVGEVSV